jgi:hypothetical protein
MSWPFLTRRSGCACLIAALISSSMLLAHPHGLDTTTVLTGTLTKVDQKLQAIEVDTIDRRTLARTNVLVFIDGKSKIRQGKTRLTPAELAPGQRVTCVAEREEDKGGRLVAIDIRLAEKS